MSQITTRTRSRSDEQITTPAVLYRGGTSKAFIVQSKDLPSQDRARIAEWVLAIYGSPDKRQIDGVGGADGLTSKFAIVGPPSRADADIDYTFAQVGITEASVDWNLICGNISAAIGPFVIDEGLVEAVGPTTTVRVHNTNTGKLIECVVQVEQGRAKVIGTTHIDGVPGTAAPILLDFRDSASTKGKGLLPTGNVRDSIDVPGFGTVEYSLVDAALPGLFLAAKRFGLTGHEGPLELEANTAAMASIDSVRRTVAFHLGWATSAEAASTEVPHTPAAILVSGPAPWTEFGSKVMHEASDCDCTVRAVGARAVHKAFMVTGSVATGIAASLPGSVLHDVTRPEAHERGAYRLAHPSGIIETVVALERSGSEILLRRAAIVRTARRLLDGVVYASRARLAWA